MKHPRLALLASALLASAAICPAATVVSYLDNAFGAGDITNNSDSLAFSSANPGVTATGLTKSITSDTDAAFSTSTGTFFAKATAVPTSGSSVWVTFTVSVASGYTLDLTSLTFNFGGSNSGASSTTYTANSAVYYSLNNFATAGTLVGSTTNSPITLAASNVINLGYNVDLDLSSIAGLSSGETISFRVAFTDNSSSGNLSLRFDNLALNSVVVSTIPEPSTYAMIAGAFALGLVVVRRRRA
ncbi:MAG: hypothetical protein K0R17_940 [Rariglobus sp.]|jgi:hypothetical protein|nr:hypothetical protein [Rariglobus sp.]